MKYTPEFITDLQPCEIFVFGSNQYGLHNGGSALTATKLFGALYKDCPMGLVDRSYGIITTSYSEVPVPIGFIALQVRVLYNFALLRPDLTFYVTKIGTGIAQFSIGDIANIFHDLETARPLNIILPKEFSKN